MSRSSQSGPTGSEPACPVIGERYFDTDLGVSVEWDGSAWNSMGGGGGGGSPNALLDGVQHNDTVGATPAIGSVVGDDGVGSWTAVTGSGGANTEFLSLPPGGGAPAWAAGVPAADVTPAGGAGQGLAPVGATVAATAAPAAGWSSTGPYATMLNAMMPLPVGAWFEKL